MLKLKEILIFKDLIFWVFNATFNDITAIMWQSVLLVEYLLKTADLAQVRDKLHHIMLYRVHLTMNESGDRLYRKTSTENIDTGQMVPVEN